MRRGLSVIIVFGLFALAMLALLLISQPVYAQGPILNNSFKSAPVEVTRGDVFTYTITLVNSSIISDALSATVSDTLPAGVSYIPGTLTATSGIVTPTAGGIAWSGVVSASSRVTVTFAVTATAQPGEIVTNSAVISDTALAEPVIVTAATRMALPDLGNSTKVAPLEVASGDTFTYTIVVVNSSIISDALSATVSDTLPAGVSYIPGTLTATSGIVTPTAGGIAWSGVVSASSRVTVTFAVTATAQPGEIVTNSAVISDTALAEPVIVTAATRMALPDLGNSTKVAPLEVASGDTFTYTISLVNSSIISDALSATVSDTLPAGVSYIPGTLTATSGIVTPTAGGIAWSGVVSASSRVTVTFAVTATAQPGEIVTNSAVISDTALAESVIVTAATRMALPDLGLSHKTCSDDRLPEGEVVDYIIVIENSGAGNAIQTTLSDTIPAGTVYVTGTAWASSGVVTGTATVVEWSGSVSAGQSVTVSFAVSVTASPGEVITNTAIISDVDLVAPVVVSVTNPVIPYINFELNKVVTPTVVEPGETLTYTVRFTNSGRYTAANMQLVDLIPANTTYNSDAVASRPTLVSSTTAITWTGDLEVGAGVVITFSVQVSPTFHGFITNTAIISQVYLPGLITQEAVAIGIPILSIEKSAAPEPVGPGKLLTYTLTVRNVGSIASGLVITDHIPLSTTYVSGGTLVTATGVVSWTPAFTLPTGAWTTFVFTVRVSESVISGTFIVNDDYRVTSAEGDWAIGAPVATLVLNPILDITKWALPDPPGANRGLTYWLNVQNTGSLATALLITDVVPSNVTYITGGTYISATGVVSWTWPSLDYNANQVLTYQVAVGNLFSGTEIINGRYVVSCSEGIAATGGPLTLTIEPPILDESYKYADPIAVKPGETLDYIVVIHNSGASNAINAVMTDTFPVNVASFQACAASSGVMVTCGNVGGFSVAEWNGDILYDQPVYITLTTKINPGQNAGDLINTAYITDDLFLETKIVTASAFVTRDPFLRVSKTDTPDPVAPGRFITYTITVENTGLPTDDSVVLTDTVPADTTYVDSDGYYITATNVVTWSLPKLQAGDSVQRMLVVQVDDVPNGTFIYNDDYWANCDICTLTHGITVTTLVQLPLQASKHVTPELVIAGEILTFTVSVENILGITATQTMISDTIPANTTYVIGSLSYPIGNASDDAGILANGYLTWTGDIPSYGAVDITFQTQISPSFFFGTITNTAVISQSNLVYRPLTATTVAVVSSFPLLRLTKVPSALTIEPLQALTYTLWLTNTGREATDIVVTDPVPTHTNYVWSDGTLITPTNVVSWTWPSLDFGQSVSFTLVVSVNIVPSGTQIVNLDYTVACTEGVGDVGEPVTTTVVVQDVFLNITKTDHPDPVMAGAPLTYTIVVQNSGSIDATNTTITDTIPADTTFAWADAGGSLVGGQVVWTGLTVSASASLTVNLGVTVDAPLPDGTVITNDDYWVTSDGGGGAVGSPVTTTVRAPTLSITKTDHPDPVMAGAPLTYTIVVQNSSSIDATNTTITDTIPADTTFAWTDAGGSLVGNQVVWTGLTVSASASLTVNLGVTVDAPLPDGTVITNTEYWATSDGGGSAVGSPVTTTVQAPTLSITKTDHPDPVMAGAPLTYTIVVQNSGSIDATNVTITDTIPADTTFAWADAGGSLVGNRVVWSGQVVSTGGSLTVSFGVTVDAPLPDGTIITNDDYWVSSDGGGGAVGSPVTTTVRAPTLSITKTDHPDPVMAGAPLTYTIVVQNSGSIDATNVTITDTIPADTMFAWADAGGSLVGNRVVWSGQVVSAGGSLTVNLGVTVDAPLPGGTVITNTEYWATSAEGATAIGSPVTTTVQSTPFLSITKTGRPDPVTVGEALTYTIVVQNSGSADATNVTITDTIPADTMFAWADTGGSLVGNQVVWSGLTVPADSSLTVSFGVTVIMPLAGSGIITNADYWVTSAEGISAYGEPVETTVQFRIIYLPLVFKGATP